MSVSCHNIARNYFRRIGKSAASPECDTLGEFLTQVANLGLMGNLTELWIHRSGWNAGAGATSYGVLGQSNMTLVASPTWGVNGLTLDGVSQHAWGLLPLGQTSGTLMVVGCGASVVQPNSAASFGTLVSSAGRNAAGGGDVSAIYFNAFSPVSTDSYTGALQSDTLQCAPVGAGNARYYATGNPPNDFYFRMFTHSVDSATPAANNWIDTDVSPHVTPRTMTNLSDRVTNGSMYDNPGFSKFLKGTIALCICWKTALTDAQVQALYPIIRRTIASGLLWVNDVVVDGDSIISVTSIAQASRWHEMLMFQSGANSWVGRTTRRVSAGNGETSASRLAGYAATVGTWKPKSAEERPYYFLDVGVNDLLGGVDKDVIWANMQLLWQQARRDGYKVIAHTIVPNNTFTPQNTADRVLLNTRILNARGNRQVDYVVDLAAMFLTYNATDFVDQTHLSVASNLAWYNSLLVGGQNYIPIP